MDVKKEIIKILKDIQDIRTLRIIYQFIKNLV